MNDGIFIGRTGWDYTTGSEVAQKIEKAIIRKNGLEVVIEFENDDGRYTASLQRTIDDNTYQGNFIYRSGGYTSTGSARCKLFQSDDDIILFGRWTEDNISFYWWAEIYKDD